MNIPTTRENVSSRRVVRWLARDVCAFRWFEFDNQTGQALRERAEWVAEPVICGSTVVRSFSNLIRSFYQVCWALLGMALFLGLNAFIHDISALAQENLPIPTNPIRDRMESNANRVAIIDSNESATTGSVLPLDFFAGNSSEPVDPKKPIVLTAGHLTLRWQAHPEARGYRIVDQADRIHYEGRMAIGFVSGLENGDYTFTAVALDEQETPIARSSIPIQVAVEHHSMMVTWVIFSIGASVMVCLFVVMLIGIRRQEGQ